MKHIKNSNDTKTSKNKTICPEIANSALTLLNAISDCACLVNKNGNIEWANTSACKLLSGKKNVPVGQNIFDLLSGEQKLLFKNNFTKAVKNQKNIRYETSDKSKWSEINLHPIKDKNNKVLHVAVYSKDITEHKMAENALHKSEDITENKFAEEALRISEENYRTLFNTMTQGVIYQDASGKIISANPAAERILGITHDQMMGLTSMDPRWKAVKEDGSDFPGNMHPLPIAIRTGKEVKGIVHGIYNPEKNDYVWIKVTAVPLSRSGEKKPYQAYAVFEDITEQLISEKNYRMLFSEMLDGFALHEMIYNAHGEPADYRFIAINPAFERMTGLSADNIVGKRVLDALPGTEEYWIKTYGKVALTGEPVQFENYTSTLNKHFKVTAFRPAPNQFAVIFSDITDRKLSEEALKASEEKYYRLFSEIIDGCAVCRIIYNSEGLPVDYVTLEVNKAYEKIVGINGDFFIGKKVSEILPSDELKLWLKIFGPIVMHGGSKNYEQFSPLYKKYFEGNVFSFEKDIFVATFRDITKRKKSEQSLRASEERFKHLVESVTDYIYTVEIENGRAVKTAHGPGCIGVTGYTPEEFNANPHLWFNMIYEEDKDYVFAHIEKLLRGEDIPPLEHRIIHKNGSILWIKDTSVLQKNNNDILIGYDGLISDITERRQAEEALKLSEEKYRNIFESAPEGIFQSNAEEKFINVNPSYANILGYDSPEELLSKISSVKDQLFVNTEDYIYFINKIKDEGKIESFEHQFYKKDGTKTWVSANVRAERGKDGKLHYFEGVVEDISRRKQAEDDKNRLEAQLRQAQKMEALGTFVGGIAHDFNNILSVLIGYSTLMKMELEKNSPLSGYVEQILTSSEKAANLTKSLLAFSRNQPMSHSPVNLNEKITDIEKILRRIITEDISLNIKLCKNEINVMGDISQIDQLFFNLATNARDALPKGGIINITTSIIEMDENLAHILGYEEPGKYALITFADNGMGMDEKTREHIFDPFFTTKEVGKGTGLGMATVYGIVKQHSGHISIYSESGLGTAFHIYIPLSSESLKKEKEKISQMKKGSETILIAEDNENVRLLMNSVLTKYGYTIIEAVDGEDAINKFNEFKNPDLVILDSVMPNKNGREVYDEIIKINPDIRVLFCSGYTRDVVLDKGIEEKEVDFLTKPITPNALLEKVREILDR